MERSSGLVVLSGESEELVAEWICTTKWHHGPTDRPIVGCQGARSVEVSGGAVVVASASKMSRNTEMQPGLFFFCRKIADSGLGFVDRRNSFSAF